MTRAEGEVPAGPRAGGGAPADLAGRLLGWAVRLLPPAGRREWGRAMQAELAQIESAAERRRFALGCMRASLTQPRLLVAAGYPSLMLGAIAGTVVWTGRVTYAPLRAGLIGLVAILLALSWLARRPGVFGPVAEGLAARLVRVGGYLLVGASAVLTIHSLRLATNSLPEKAGTGVPIITTVLVLYTVAFVTVTARGSAAGMRVLAIGGGCGVAAAVACLVPVLVFPPLPVSSAWAIAAIATAGCAAALISVSRSNRSGDAGRPALTGVAGVAGKSDLAGRTGPVGQSLIALLCAATVAALLIFVYVDVLLQFFPHWVPDTSPVNVPAANRLDNNRRGAEDPYFAILLMGGLLAATLSTVIIATRRPQPGRPEPLQPGAPSPPDLLAHEWTHG
ncbi:hypothetical protein AB0O34_07835 [Sphaerisporangium sp. NPDC088356]|uniref:hypothetical protein n=1 Tax=Sphaerisporangium sp. NPDC088356 TaxID=3154871 RepID=UPI003429E0C8